MEFQLTEADDRMIFNENQNSPRSMIYQNNEDNFSTISYAQRNIQSEEAYSVHGDYATLNSLAKPQRKQMFATKKSSKRSSNEGETKLSKTKRSNQEISQKNDEMMDDDL